MAAAAGEVPEAMLKMLECSVCFSYYNLHDKQAKVLNCGHSFCELCVKAMAKGDMIRCPQCRGRGLLSGVKQNFAINSLLETLCRDCTVKLKIRACLHCPKELCDVCFTQHIAALRKEAIHDLDVLSEETLQATSLIKKKCQMKEEEIRRDKVKASFRNDIQKIHNHLDQFQKEQEQHIDDIGRQNLQVYKTWTTSMQVQIGNADRLVEKRNHLQNDETETSIVQMKEECSSIHKTMKEVQQDLPIMLEYKLKPPTVCQEFLQMLENTKIEKSLSKLRGKFEGPFYDYSNARLTLVFGGFGFGQNKFNEPVDVAVARNGNVYFTDSRNHRVKVYDSNFKRVSCFGKMGNGREQFTYPTGICLNDNSDVFVLDADRIQMFSTKNKLVKEILEMKQENRAHKSLSALYFVIDSNNMMYVSDCNDKCISICDSDGNFQRSFGHGIFHDIPRNLVLTSKNKLLVTERLASKIHMFDVDGHYHSEFKLKHIPQNLRLEEPRGVVVDKNGNIIVGDKDKILVFDNEGNFLCQIGKGRFNVVSGIALDNYGHLIVCDRFNHKIHVFDLLG